MEEELLQARNQLKEREKESQQFAADRAQTVELKEQLEQSSGTITELRKRISDKEKEFHEQLRDAHDKAQKASLYR